jgi:predicted RNA-binding Zn-ribbon protein involved in translation (DUF1610 family)
MTPTDSACRCVVLATADTGQVSTCPECGTIHISMPQMSLRLTRETFRSLAGLVTSAHVELDGATAQAAPHGHLNRALH